MWNFDTNKAWATQKKLTEMHGSHIDFGVCLIRFGSVAIPNLKNISIRAGAGPRVAKTLILHKFVDRFRYQLRSKIAKSNIKNTLQI